MEINNIDSKNLIITTEIGSKIEIKNNQIIIFGNNEIGLSKIKSIGDFTIDVDEDNLNQTIDSKNKTLGILKISIIFISILTIIEFFSWANIQKSPLFGGEIVLLIIVIIIYFAYVKTISILKDIDFSKNDYPLNVDFEYLDGKNKTKKTYTICKGSKKELKHIKKLLLEKKEVSLLS